MFELPPQDAQPAYPPQGNPPAIVRRIDLEKEALPPVIRNNIEDLQMDALAWLETLRRLYVPTQSAAADHTSTRLAIVANPGAPSQQMENPQPPPAVAPAPAAEGPQALSPNMNPSYYDGGLIGADGKIYPASSSFASIRPVTPWSRPVAAGEPMIIYVNGISTPPSMANYHMHNIAAYTGQPVIGVYNATDGDIQDVLQGICDKANIGYNPAVETLTREIQRALITNEKLHLLGESHGALVISRSIGHARDALKKAGWNSNDIEIRLSNITVETFGGSAWSYPDGPRYVHYINEHDPVPFHFGLTAYGLSSDKVAELEATINQPDWIRRIGIVMDVFDTRYFSTLHPGRDARIVRFRYNPPNAEWLDTHMVETYLQYRTPVEQAIQTHKPAEPADFEAWGAIRTTAKWLTFAGILYWAVRGVRRLKRAIQSRFTGRKGPTGNDSKGSEGAEPSSENSTQESEE
jgi:hypothetical protein